MDPVLKRRLFMEPPVRKASGGILSLVEDDEEEDSYDDRTPENPEIMANALRGDMRSMDERYLELAQMVGEVAFETPEEVLVLMQPQLAQQQAQQQPPTAPAAGPQGLAALGQGVPPGGAPPGGAPPGGAMPPGMPMEAPPEMGPQGIAALAPENEPPPPVQRSDGSPPMGEFSRPNAYTGEDVPPGDLDQEIEAFLAGGGNEQDLVAAASGDIPEVVVGEGMPPGAEIPGIAEAGMTPEMVLSRQPTGGGGPPSGQAKGMNDLSRFFPRQEEQGVFSEEFLRQQQEKIEDFIRRQERKRSGSAESNPLLAPMPTGFEEPVRRARGSGPGGERVEPQMPRPAQIPRNAPSYIQDLMRQGVVSPDYSNIPKSSPFTPEELAERVRQRENQSPLMRRIYDFARQRGVDPNIAEDRIKRFLKLPGVQAVSKAGGVAGRALFNPLTALGTLSAQFGYNMAPSLMGVTPIPEEFRTEPGVLPGVNPLPVGQMKLPDGSPSLADRIPPQVPEGGVPAGPGPEEFPPSEPRALTPVDATSPPVVDIGDVGAEESYSPTRGRDPQGAVLPPPGLAGPDERRTEVTTTERVPAQQEGESDSEFAQRVRERARLYKELLGDNDAARKAQAYGILAEVGWRLAGAKGRSLGERLSKGMEGAGAAFGQLAANQAAQERQTMASAIAAVEQEDRDAMRFATQIRTKQMEIEKSNLPRQQRIAQRAALIQATTPSITPEGATRLATMQEDKIVTTDELGNIRDPANQVLAYGPANQPTPEGGVGYIARDYPFLRTGAAKPAVAATVQEMQQARDERAAAQSLLSGLQRAKGNLSEAYGPMNVILRGVTSVVQPIVGNIGPIDASNFGAANAIRQFQKDLRELLVLNPNRATKYELELMEPLMDNPNNILKSPDIALANLLEIERTLINRINSADYKLNPNVEYKQIGQIPLGTKQQPLPSNALGYMGEHFKAVPNSTVYYQRADGRVIGLNKQQYDQMMRGQ